MNPDFRHARGLMSIDPQRSVWSFRGGPRWAMGPGMMNKTRAP